MEYKKIIEAINYMVKVHDGQTRKENGLPKSSHLFGVAMTLMKYKFRDEVVVAGLLHDVIEDTDHQISEIEELFGKEVALLVQAETEIDKRNPWKLRKETQIAHFKSASYEEKAVGAADKMHNLLSLMTDYQKRGNKVFNSFNAGKEDIIWYYNTIIEAITEGVEGEIFTDLKKIKEEMIVFD